MTTTILSNVKTGEIRIGDIVLTHGMRVRIDEIRTYPGDAGQPETETVYACLGALLNLDEVREAGIVPRSFLYNEARHSSKDAPGAREDYWNVQGNNLARWTVERDNHKGES